MSPFQVNPANASIDIDSITLYKYSTEKVSEGSFQIKIWLSGGFGRVFLPKIGHKLVDKNIEIEAHALFEIAAADAFQLEELLTDWEKVSPPLRFLDFGDRAMLLEDGDRFIVLPKGFRDIKFDMSAPFS